MSQGAVVLVLFGCLMPAALAQDLPDRVRQMEAEGNSSGARSMLERTVRDSPDDSSKLLLYAEFLDRHGDSEARQLYARLIEKDELPDEDRLKAARRLAVLDLLAGDRDSAARYLADFRAAGGTGLTGVPASSEAPKAESEYIEIPGPLGSFARMAAISPDLDGDQILPALARNVITNGYRVTASYDGLQPTEYMKLVNRYLSQARELGKLADETGTIAIEACDSVMTADLLRVLGYRMRGGCGSDVILVTVNASRAFLTIDSGFPLADLETALRTNRPFRYDYRPARIPVLYSRNYWISENERESHTEFIDAFTADPSLCRFYLAMSKMDESVTSELRSHASAEKLKAFAHVLDFFGGLLELRNGKAETPGDPKAWTELVGVSPDKGAEFYLRLIALDDGWLASYYDAVSRTVGPVRDYLTSEGRLQRYYRAIRGKVTSPGPARPVFRANADLMLLMSRLWLSADGTPHIPGDIGVWRRLFSDTPHRVYDKKLKKLAAGWSEADDVVEALFALCRKPVDNEPLKIYMTLSDINRIRETPLRPETAERLARSWDRYGDQYPLFTETGALTDETILAFLDAAEGIDDIGNRLLRANTAGSMQATVGLWQIFVRNDIIAEGDADRVLAGILTPFGKLANHEELFDRSERATKDLMEAARGSGDDSVHDRMMGLLAGSAEPNDAESYRQVVDSMRRIFAAQKLVELDLVFEVADHLQALASGAELDTALVNRLSTKLDAIQFERESLSSAEKNAIAFGYWSERHLNQERKLDVKAEFRKAARDPGRARELRGDLAFLLRDTLVGYNYLHYAPAGAELLRTNPLFVRGHDFLGNAGESAAWREADVYGTGWPSSAGGRLVGSLAGLPYVLAEAEQNFLVPESEQALIWADLVPQMMMSAKIQRWWNVSPDLQHWVALHVRLGETGIAEGSLEPDLLKPVMAVIRGQAPPARAAEIERLIKDGNPGEALNLVTPNELFLLGKSLAAANPEGNLLSREIHRLADTDSGRVNYDAVSRAFGSPKPKLAHSYRPGLLNLRTFPTLMGYSSRIMAESWESSLLYYATLADDLYMRPSELNVRVPQWTQKTVETIFATHLEDWPAVLHSLRVVGRDVRASLQPKLSEIEQAALEQR